MTTRRPKVLAALALAGTLALAPALLPGGAHAEDGTPSPSPATTSAPAEDAAPTTEPTPDETDPTEEPASSPSAEPEDVKQGDECEARLRGDCGIPLLAAAFDDCDAVYATLQERSACYVGAQNYYAEDMEANR